MAGDWIKMRGNLWDDPRVSRLVDLTDTSEAQIIGGLYWLWASADQHTEDGVMPGLSLRQIDRKTGIQGFGEALVSIGWLADHPEGVRIVNFEEHNGSSAKARASTAKRVASFKSKVTQESENANAEVTVDALPKQHETVTDALPREEKRREEKKEEQKNSEAKASGETPPVKDEKQELYAAGKSLLELRGMPKAQCGSFITKLARDYGQDIAIDAVRSAVQARPLEATQYLVATCQTLKGQRKPQAPPITVPSKAADDTARLLATQAAHAAQAVTGASAAAKAAEIRARLARVA